MTLAEEYFIKLMNEMPDMMPRKTFGTWCMKTTNGKSVAMLWKDNMVVKLKGESLKEAMNLDGTKPFEFIEGRPMKDWIQIPYSFKDEWKKFAIISSESLKTA